MKRLITTLLLTITLAGAAQAQDAYYDIRTKAQAVVNDPAANELLKNIATFKVDALDYLAMKMKEQMPDSTVNYLDKQAVAMNNFVSLYIKRLIELNDQPQAMQVKMTKHYMDASYSNPLFKDNETEPALSYYLNKKAVTRFSLNTNWLKAVNAALKEKK